MKNKSVETLLYSGAGLVFVALALVAINLIAQSVKVRADLTKEKAYTLSPGTRAILKKLDTPVKIRFYCSQGESASPDVVFLKGYAKQVRDLLLEYKHVAGGKLTIEEYDPEPASDAEDSARLDGIEARNLRSGEHIYLGLCVDMAGEKQSLPFLDPSRERLLEYDLSRAITRVGITDKPVVGIMSPLPVFGMPANPMMMRMGQGGNEPWAVVTELKRDYEVKRVGMDVDKIDDDIKVLIVIHPRDITDKAMYAIDQFVLRGGKLMAFLDPLPAIIDAREQQGFGQLPNSGSNMDKLLKNWGLTLDVSKVVADTRYMIQVDEAGTRAPAIIQLSDEALNGDDIVTSQLGSVLLAFAGAFTGTPADGLKETVLMRSSPDSQLVDGFMANLSGPNVLKDFKASGTRYPLAVRLTGKFKTAFPNGKPEDKKDEEKKDDDKDKKAEPKKPDDSLKQSVADNSVILVGDADFLGDGVAVQRVNTLFGPMMVERGGNLPFAQNALEQLTGDNNLIAVRSRASLDYPLEEIQKMENKANEEIRTEIKSVEDDIAAANKKMGELEQAKGDKDQRVIRSAEQQAEFTRAQKRIAEGNKKLAEIRKRSRRAIVKRENVHTWMDILAVPVGVILAGVAVAVVKVKKTSAK
jgi:ABC-type uncharacterized transport system involved in gliding motility auxiliary subunit